MSKLLLVLVSGFVFLLGPGESRAQNEAQRKALQSEYTTKARACMKDLAEAGRAEGVETHWEGGDILLRDPDKEDELGDMLGTMFDCLKEAFGRDKQEIDRLPGSGVRGAQSFVWYAKVESLFVWCASPAESTPDNPGTFGGNGPKRNHYAITFQCSVSETVLNWYKPTSALPDDAVRPVRYIVPDSSAADFGQRLTRAGYSDCMQGLANAGKREGLEFELVSNEVYVISDKKAELVPLWAEMESCLKENFTRQRTGTGLGRAAYQYRQWFNETNGIYEWCTKANADTDPISYNSSANHYALVVRCGKGTRELPNGMFF